MFILIITKAFLKPQSIQLCKVYNAPGVHHLTLEWNNFKNDLLSWQQPATFLNIYMEVCVFKKMSFDNNFNFYPIVKANGLF